MARFTAAAGLVRTLTGPTARQRADSEMGGWGGRAVR